MVVEEVLSGPETIIDAVLVTTRWLQAVGALIFIWIIIQVSNWLINRKRLKELYKIKDDMARIENKIDFIKKARN